MTWMVLLVTVLLQQVRDVAPRPPTTAVLVGVVVTDDTQGMPVRRARVSISAAEVGSGRTTITDDEGRFAFTGIPTGTYTVSATRPGWVPMQYGAKRPDRPGTRVPLKGGERASITMRLTRGAVITGTITEQDGRPAPNVAVRAMRWAFQRGERRLVPAGSSIVSDDRGIYRIYALPAGDYIIGASYGTGGRAAIGELQLTTDLDVAYASSDPRSEAPGPAPRTVDFAPIYFPGTLSPLQASPVSVRAGEERTGVDLVLQLIQTARVNGSVTMPDGSPPIGAAVVTLLATAQGPSFPGIPTSSYRTISAQADGSFEFSNVAPGPYTLIARARGADPLSAAMSVQVDGDEVSGISLTLGRGITIAGQVRFETIGGTQAPDRRSVRISLQPVQGQATATISPASASIEGDGRFSLTGVTPGDYRLTATVGAGMGTSPWQVKSATIGGRDALDSPAVLSAEATSLDAIVTFTDKLAELKGMLENAGGGAAPGYTIVLFAAEQSLWSAQSRRIQAVRPAADGSYDFRNILSGNYLLAAVDDAEPDAWYDPAWLQALVPAAMKISIAEGQLIVRDLRLDR